MTDKQPDNRTSGEEQFSRSIGDTSADFDGNRLSGSAGTSMTSPACPLSQRGLTQLGQRQFVEEIDYNEIETEEVSTYIKVLSSNIYFPQSFSKTNINQLKMIEENTIFEEDSNVVGKGSFGVVWKGRWRGQYVAVKHIDTEGERRAFAVEVRQLSRVAHPNIVRLYGACTKNPVCLVMEYAEGGSLYNVLHCEPQPKYTAAHAMSWTLQCACGVAYLHNMKPKPLIHRDLKPPNLLLVLGGRTLKICDFGTACDLNTYMTNNKGSAAWMAPEVFEGSRYTEKCDVFSWGVILWEVLSRRKPFDDIGGSAYRIMWAVHIGQRPPLIEGCPKPIKDLIIRCWRKIPEERPSMNEVVRIMTSLSELFKGHIEPLEYSPSSTNTNEDMEMEEASEDEENERRAERNEEEEEIAMPISATMRNDHNSSSTEAAKKKRLMQREPSIVFNVIPNTESESALSVAPCAVVTHVSDINDESTSLNNRLNTGANDPSAGIRDQRDIENRFQPLHVYCEPDAWETGHSSDSSWEIRNMAGLDKMLPKSKTKMMYSSTSGQDLDNVYRLLDADLRPVTPDHTCQLSQDIFQQHKKLAQEYLKIQTEIAIVGHHKTEMLKSLSGDALRQQRELQKLEDEKESLVKLYRNLKRQLEIMKGRARTVVAHDSTSEAAPSVIPGDDGWVVVARHEPSKIS